MFIGWPMSTGIKFAIAIVVPLCGILLAIAKYGPKLGTELANAKIVPCLRI